MSFCALSPAKRIPACAAFQFRSVNEYRLVIRFSLLLQIPDILVKQILHRFGAATCPKACKGGIVRRLFVSQQPHEIYTIAARFLQLPAGIDSTLVAVDHYLEHDPRVGDRFPSSGRIRFIQSPVVQFLKLGAGQPDGLILR